MQTYTGNSVRVKVIVKLRHNFAFDFILIWSNDREISDGFGYHLARVEWKITCFSFGFLIITPIKLAKCEQMTHLSQMYRLI